MNLENSIIKAQTFTPMYSQSEDRIRLVINYTDYSNRVDLWLTRVFLLKLIPTIEDCLDQFFDVSQNDEVQRQWEENVQSQTDTSTLIMTEKEGYLVHSVDITYHNENNQFEVVFKTNDPWVVASLDASLLRVILKSIFASIPKIDWGISPHWVQ